MSQNETVCDDLKTEESQLWRDREESSSLFDDQNAKLFKIFGRQSEIDKQLKQLSLENTMGMQQEKALLRKEQQDYDCDIQNLITQRAATWTRRNEADERLSRFQSRAAKKSQADEPSGIAPRLGFWESTSHSRDHDMKRLHEELELQKESEKAKEKNVARKMNLSLQLKDQLENERQDNARSHTQPLGNIKLNEEIADFVFGKIPLCGQLVYKTEGEDHESTTRTESTIPQKDPNNKPTEMCSSTSMDCMNTLKEGQGSNLRNEEVLSAKSTESVAIYCKDTICSNTQPKCAESGEKARQLTLKASTPTS
ncbi:uncharacterized protein LOC134196444 isoform X2 [Corticium candelabrum]|uniref:uncharacterized protein LOC134196444 isoform X2 n=1 Tax=Corticium candelabrum TaxID=121492 RepID=UPI002E253704|nr:uncharacterized protein LOC134196444 isoform X2 [Corticium candelabrum]